MAYGDNRQQSTTDSFDASISANWTNGVGGFDEFAWATGGHVNPAGTSGNTRGMRYDGGDAPANDQYARVTLQSVVGGGSNYCGVACRWQGTTSQACYAFYAGGADYTYALIEHSSTGSETSLATTGTGATRSAGDILTLEVEGTTLRGGSVESGGSDTQRLTTTDNTLGSGRWGMLAWTNTDIANARATGFEGGDIAEEGGGEESIIPLVMHHRRMLGMN